jgi:hypothetical protein
MSDDVDNFEIDTNDMQNLSVVPTEILVTLCLAIIEELEIRVNKKVGLRAVN